MTVNITRSEWIDRTDKSVLAFNHKPRLYRHRVLELCESRGGRPGLPVLMSLTVSVDVKQH